jgi:hypothetical protein
MNRRRRALAPSLVVVTVALGAACTRGGDKAKTPTDETGTKTTTTDSGDDHEKSWVEFRNGKCTVIPDCSPPPGENFNPCNPPPPQTIVPCTPELLPTQPPDTKLTKDPDGTCWVDCTDKTCDAEGPLRVNCPAANAPAPTYATNIVVPKATSARYDTGVFHRLDDLTCDLVECEAGTKCATPPGKTDKNVPCPPELVPKVASGVVPVLSSKRFSCFYGMYAVECPKKFHVWH